MGRFFNSKNIAFKKQLIPIGTGLLFTLILATILWSSPPNANSWTNTLENRTYDFLIPSGAYQNKSRIPSVSIVDIDDQSINKIGRWPWPRDQLGVLCTTIHNMGAAVIASDILFTEPEKNIINEVITSLPSSQSEILPTLKQLKSRFDYDAIFAKAIGEAQVTLSFVFTNELQSKGLLPPPLLDLKGSDDEQLAITQMHSYYANLPILQKATQYGGFINSTPDRDGILRYSPIVIRYNDLLYPSLGLKAATLFLFTQNIKLIAPKYGQNKVLEGIQLDPITVPTDPWGRMLIPYRKAPFTFPKISAADVLEGKVKAELLKDKLVFIGSSATAIGDLKATPLASLTMGTEIHAFIAAGIIDRYLPYKPTWGKGVSFIGVLAVGTLCAIVFPLLGPLLLTLATAIFSSAICAIVYFLWTSDSLVIPLMFPFITVLFIYLFNLIYGYFFEIRREHEIKERFSQFVPPDYVNIMLKEGGDLSMEGESKEISVLFADIRNFTHLSENMKASELKQFLNSYLTPVTQTIFEHRGTIDKYVGDLVMAFWGAPLPDPKHAIDAIATGFAMQERVKALNVAFQKQHLPSIQIGVGINTGIASVGDMGSEFRRAYTVLGDHVNVASRLEGITKVYHVDILVGENTWQQAKEDYLFRKIDQVMLKGKTKGIYIYQPICHKNQGTSLVIAELQKYDQALELYWKQEWDSAEKLLLELKGSSPQNTLLYDVFLARIQEFRTHKPPDHWDGVHILKEK